MVDADNFVGRFRVFAIKLGSTKKPSREQLSVPQALAEALGTSTVTVEFHHRVVLLVELAARALQQTEELLTDDPSQDIYVETIQNIGSTLNSLDMRVNWSQYAGSFNPTALAHLVTCERAVSRHITVAPPTKEKVDEVLAAIREAIDCVRNAEDIEEGAKLILLEMLRDVERALVTYEISGFAGLRRAGERTLGASVLHSAILEPSRDLSVVKKAFKALGSALGLVKNLVFIKELPEKAGGIFKFLSGGE